jgi:ribosome maturation factor RimP
MRLNEQIAKIVESHGATLYKTEILNDNGKSIFRVNIVKGGGVTLDLCAEISNELSPFLDVNPPIQGAYFLEVSSAGIERRLETPLHFSSAVGERIKFKTKAGEKLRGVLKSANAEGFSVEIKGEDISYNYSDISKAKTYYEWNKK